MNRLAWLALLPLAAAACTPASYPASNAVAPTPEPTVAPTFPPARDYVGRWTGVEGMFLDVAATNRPDRYRLTVQYDLDNRQTLVARLDGQALRFTRDGNDFTLAPTDGKATGLKYLAGKNDCLTVMPGEGYCRD